MAHDVGTEFAARLDTIGFDTRVLLWADETRWANLDTGDMGLQTDAARERVAAMTVLGGCTQPAASRDSLAESLDREPVATLLPETRESARENTARLEGRWALSRVHQFHRDGVRLDDKDAARLLVAVESIPIRDRLWLDMNRGNAASHVALWTDMTKRAPDKVRAAPASLLAFGSWLSGHGAMAWCALDQVPEGKPYALANLVAAAVQGGCTRASGRPPSPCPQSVASTAPRTSPDRRRALSSAPSGPPIDSEEKAMKNSYRRRPPFSRLERLLTGLLPNQSRPDPAETRVDVAHTEEVEFRQV